MSLKGKLEAIIYAAEEPVTIDQMAALLRNDVLAELAKAEAEPITDTMATAEQSQFPAEVTAESSGIEPAVDSAPEGAAENAPEPGSKKRVKDPELTAVKARLRELLTELIADYQTDARGIEIRQVAGGFRMATKPEHHDVVVGFAKSLKPPIRLSLQALETLAVVAYKQPVTAPEVSEIRGVDSAGVIATLLDRKLVTTAGRKQVIGRPILYKTTKEFLLRFGLKDVNELPSMEEFEKLGDAGQGVLLEHEAPPTQTPAERAEDAMLAREDEMVAAEHASASEQEEPAQEAAPQAAETQNASSEVEGSNIEKV